MTATPIPLTILTGFLGAGKTTVLNRILNGDHGLRVGVMVNDFGAVNIDAQLIVGVRSDVISLANGCVCCSIRGDLVDAVAQVIARPERPEYIVLEASGVAEPSGIALTFAEAGLREIVRLDGISCVVDAEQVFAAPEWMELKIWQLAFADLVILNKVDLVDQRQLEAIKDWLGTRMHRYRLVEACHGDVPMEVLLGVGRFDPTRQDARRVQEVHRHEASQNFSTWSFEAQRPVSLETLRSRASRLPASVYRAKGVVYSAEAPEQRAVLQVVGKRVDVSLLDAWGDRIRRTQIVVIGAPRALDACTLQETFEFCISPGKA